MEYGGECGDVVASAGGGGGDDGLLAVVVYFLFLFFFFFFLFFFRFCVFFIRGGVDFHLFFLFDLWFTSGQSIDWDIRLIPLSHKKQHHKSLPPKFPPSYPTPPSLSPYPPIIPIPPSLPIPTNLTPPNHHPPLSPTLPPNLNLRMRLSRLDDAFQPSAGGGVLHREGESEEAVEDE